MTAAFEDVREADDVAVDVGKRILQRVAHAGLRREVNHALELLAREQLRHPRPVGEIQLDEAEVRPLPQLREPRLLQRDVVVVVEVVEPDDFVAALQQELRGVEADEAGRAGDEKFHEGLSVRTRSLTRLVDRDSTAP